MIFSSLTFIFVFLPIFLLAYFIAPSKIKNIVLLAFSLLFYSWGEPIYILLLLLSSVVDFSNGYFINKFKADKRKKKFFLILSIIINLSLLAIFKYSNFIISNLNIFGIKITGFNIMLPLGISFFTFQTMSYSIDVYRGNIKYEKNFINFMTYVCMFPQLVAGPIVRYSDISKELQKREHSFKNFSEGIFRFLTGLFKKVLIANYMGLIFDLIAKNTSSISLATAWIGAICYTFQIFFDFSGYSDMAIGLGKMLGFNYPENFNYPYISKSITEFWRRWHITLSVWFKDYVYIPLGGNRVSKKRHIFNLFLVWFLTGLWHGASWNFVIWGLYFFVLLILEKYLFSKIKIPNFLAHIITLFLIIISWVIFAFDDLNVLTTYLGKMFVNKSIVDNSTIFFLKNYIILFIVAIICSTPIIKKLKPKKYFKPLIVVVYLFLFIITIASLVSDSYNPFLYFRF